MKGIDFIKTAELINALTEAHHKIVSDTDPVKVAKQLYRHMHKDLLIGVPDRYIKKIEEWYAEWGTTLTIHHKELDFLTWCLKQENHK